MERGISGTPRNVRFVTGLGKLIEMIDGEDVVKKETGDQRE